MVTSKRHLDEIEFGDNIISHGFVKTTGFFIHIYYNKRQYRILMNYKVGTQVPTYKSSKYRIDEVMRSKIIIIFLIPIQ